MTGNGWFQIFLFFGLVLLLTRPLGIFLHRVYERTPTFLDRVLRPIERLIYRVCGIDDASEMDWKGYGLSMLLFSGVSLFLLYLIEPYQRRGIRWGAEATFTEAAFAARLLPADKAHHQECRRHRQRGDH